MWTLLGLAALCILASPAHGHPQGPSPGVVAVFSQAAVSKYFSATLLRNGLLQSHILAIPFPDSPHKGHPETWIKRLHVVRVFVPIISVLLQENGFAMLHLRARLHLSAKFYFGKHYERIDVIVDVNLKTGFRFVDYLVGIVDVKFDTCKSEFKIAKIIGPSHLLVNKVQPIVTTVLAASLPKSLCAVVQLTVRLARVDILYTTNVLVSIGTVATLQYQLAALPMIRSGYLVLHLNMILRTGGRFITVPISTVPHPEPSLRENTLSLGITQASLNTMFGLVVQVQAQEFICTPQVFSGAVELTNVVANLLSHQKCPKCPEKSPLKVTITLVGAKRVILEPKQAILGLSAEIAISAKGPSGTLSSLFILKAKLKMHTQASVHDSKLVFSAQLTSIELFLLASDVGPVEVSSLVKVIQLLLLETFLPHVNESLTVGIPVPSLLHINMAYPTIQIMQGLLVLCV